jgi:RNA polymerase sigma factor (sigma-70 family)
MNTGTSSAVAPDTGKQPDEDIVREVLAGNTAMFELLMRRYNERIYRAARAIVQDEQEAEDIMQQANVNAFTHLRQFNGSARFSTWLTKIAINESLARVRRRDRYEAFDDEVSNVEPFMRSRSVPFLHDPAEVGMDPAYAARTATGKYRTTPLRGLVQHPPYFHDGSAPDLPAVVNHYDTLFGLHLTAAQKADLVEYLKSL